MTGNTLGSGKSVQERAIVLGTLVAIRTAVPELVPPGSLGTDGFWLVNAQVRGFDCLIVASPTEHGVLYGVFALLSKMARGQDVAQLNEVQQPYTTIRWVDQWDNLNGSIERGYAGPSLFFEKGRVRADLTRASGYA